MEDNRQKEINIKRVVSASVIVFFLMFLFGLSHRILASKLLYTGNLPPIDPNALAGFPLDINDWTGREEPLDDVIIEATGTDAHINRIYIRNNGLDNVTLYVAFGQRARDLMPHRPEVCYVGAGWARIEKESVELSLEDGMKLPCTIMQFSKGVMEQKKIMILDYYIVDGEFSSDVELLRSKIWKGSGAVNYTAQIQISVPIQTIQDSEQAKETISDFAVDSAPLLKELLASFNVNEPSEQNIDVNSISVESERN